MVVAHFRVEDCQQGKLLHLRVVLKFVLLCELRDFPFLILELSETVVDCLIIYWAS